MHFENLDFIAMMEGGLVQAPATVQLLHFTGIDTITEAPEELQLHAPEARTPRSDQLLGFDMGG